MSCMENINCGKICFEANNFCKFIQGREKHNVIIVQLRMRNNEGVFMLFQIFNADIAEC